MTTAECMAEWERLKADPTVGRDYNGMGPKDPLQLDVPKGNFGYAKKEAKHDREATQQTKNMKLKDGDYQQWVAESQMGNTDFKSQFFKGVGVGGALAATPANFDTFSKPLPEWAAVKPPARDGTDPTATLPDAGQAKGSNAPIGDGSLGGGGRASQAATN